jgi:hypothetical protein
MEIMRYLSAAFCPTLILIVVVGCILYVFRSGNVPDREVMRNFARKYLKSNPGADEDEVREALRERYVPDPPDARPSPGWYLGPGGLAGHAFGGWLMGQRHQVHCRRIKGRIDQVVDEVFGGP